MIGGIVFIWAFSVFLLVGGIISDFLARRGGGV